MWKGCSASWGIDMQKVAFICVHNSCRSQIAEALGRHLAADVFESYSAGTELKDRINPDAVRLMKELYHIRWDIETSFRELKYALGAVQFHSRKDDFVEMELIAHLIMFNVVSRTINAVSVPQSAQKKYKYVLSFKDAVTLVRKYFRLHAHEPPDRIYNLTFLQKEMEEKHHERFVSRRQAGSSGTRYQSYGSDRGFDPPRYQPQTGGES